MGNEALRLIERLEAALLAEHGCYSHYRVVCPGCDLCKEAREFLATQPAPKCDAEYGGHPDHGTTYCDLPKLHAGIHSWEQSAAQPIEFTEEEWAQLYNQYNKNYHAQREDLPHSAGLVLAKIGRNGSLAARRGVAPCNPNPSPTKEKP